MSSPKVKSENLEKINQKLDGLTNSIESLSVRVSQIEEQDIDTKLDRITRALDQIHFNQAQFAYPPQVSRLARQENNSQRQTRPEDQPQSGATGSSPRGPDYDCPIIVTAAAVQDEYKSLRDKYANIEVPPQFKITTDRSGIRREDQTKINLIANCAKYSDTLMRLALSDTRDCESVKQQAFTIAAAQQKFLQTEYSAVVVDNSFDSQTAKFFKQLRRHTSALDPESLDDLKDAVAIASRYKPSSDRGNRARSNFRYPRRGYRGRGNSDIYSQFTGSHQVATNRSHDDD